ncbi:expressed unknown protein [Seminavis robusta]|uniref:Mitochondrial splicing suppressor 51-like C-terminal domain-containing protein n=1 Tax=Seminavis robusta TaxID=568900 RepID=A0A9N8EPQ2_9STRA|nr:expressed unknown protein [Seminavis robusta]|eukprot:Sro1618_g286390.1 n/a (509) ;mRNA; f:5303-6829
MVACANNDHSLSRSGIRRGDDGLEDEGDDPSTLAAADPDTAGGQAMMEWPAAQGYTPLGDMLGQGSILVAMPPGSVDDDEEGDDFPLSFPPNAFVADANALFAFPPADDDNDDESEEAHQDGNATANHETDGDFRQLADNALFALENEYQATLSMPSLSSQPPLSLFDSNNTTNPTEQSTKSETDASTIQENFADFDSQQTAISSSTSIPTKKVLPPIDAAKIQQAMSGINAKQGDKLQKWQEEQQTKKKAHKQKQQQHGIIPPTPLKAFHKTTPKAIAATANLSRAATIAECLERLSHLLKCQDVLTIHIVGADHVECDRIGTHFNPLARWINDNLYAPKNLVLCLVGPNVPASTKAPINLLSSNKPLPRQRLLSAQATCHSASYHDWLEEQESDRLPDLMVCFNAGIWGYEEWKPTIRCLAEKKLQAPFVVTSYTLEEAEDDFDVMEEIIVGGDAKKDADQKSPTKALLWGPEVNPFASKQKRETATAVEGRDYRENHAWQAWRFN